jgi:hypothetical protein
VSEKETRKVEARLTALSPFAEPTSIPSAWVPPALTRQHSGRLIERGSCGPGPGTNVKSGGVEKWFTLDGWEEEKFVGDVEIDK